MMGWVLVMFFMLDGGRREPLEKYPTKAACEEGIRVREKRLDEHFLFLNQKYPDIVRSPNWRDIYRLRCEEVI